jgi:hypothetical protein
MKSHIRSWVICFVASVVSIQPVWGADKVIVSGVVKALSPQEDPIKRAKVEIYELNIGKSTRGNLELKKTTLCDEAGKYLFELNASELLSPKIIYKLALKFSAHGYHDAYQSIGPLDDVKGPFQTEQTVSLLPKRQELPDVRVASLRLNKARTIFQEQPGARKRFAVPRDLNEIKFAFGNANYDPMSSMVRRAMHEVEPLVRYIMTAASARPLEPRIGHVFSDQSGHRLIRMIVPGGKSFTTDLQKITDQDRWLRAETFRVVGSILDDAGTLALPPATRSAIDKYGPLFRGYFEPIWVLEVENRGPDRHVINRTRLEIPDVEVYMGPEEKAGVPMQTHDIFVEPRVGISTSDLKTPLPIDGAKGPQGSGLVSFQVRLNSLTPYLHYYRMRFVLLTSDHKYIMTDYFEIDM